VTDPADTTHALLQRLLEGDRTAWRDLVEQYSPILLAITRRTFSGYGVAPQRSDCEDAVADVWKNLLENDHRLVRDCLARSNLLPTLHVLAKHRAIDIMRKRRRTLSLSQGPEGQPGPEPLAPPPPADLPTEALAAALKTLTAREHTLVNLFFLQGKKYEEITALTGIPQNSIGPTISRALARLRYAMKP
jgi:RNA polymerase sigma-70 factor (ECF subfamily)